MYSHLLVLAGIVTLAPAAKLNPASYYFDICHLSDPQYDACLIKTLNKLKDSISKIGIPDLQIPPTEPFYVPMVSTGDGQGNANVHLTLKNLRIYETYTIQLREIHFDKKNWVLSGILFFPKENVEADYSLDGKILILPINGNGKAVMNLTDVTVKFKTTFDDYDRNGKTYLRVKDNKLTLDVGKARYNFQNLFNGDKQLGEQTNRFLNENWKEAFETFRELPETALAQFDRALIDRILKFFPKDELFPK